MYVEESSDKTLMGLGTKIQDEFPLNKRVQL